MLCATLKSPTPKAIEQANKEADLIELRVEHIDPRQLEDLRKLCCKPVIFKQDTVDFQVLSLAPDFLDLPFSTDQRVFENIKKEFPNIRLICSYHDFEKTGDLEELFMHISSKPADLYKIATFARTSSDALKMLLLMREKKCIGVCMGEYGSVTRILAPVVNAPWTYAPVSENQKTAPGQLLISELTGKFHVRALSPTTALYGLIGDPVTQSKGDTIHNFTFRHLGLDAVYVKMRVSKEELPAFFPLCQKLGFKGLSVTIPHKQNLGISEGPINTIRFDKEKISGWNTDGVAALDAIEKTGNVHGKTIVVIGAGGTGWAIAREAKKRGAHLVIINRTFPRAETLAKRVSGRAFPLQDFHIVAKIGYDVLVNSTSLGMSGEAVISPELLLENKIVMDCVVTKELTPFLKAAKSKNCHLIEGKEMWIKQAALQYCHWFAAC